MQYVVDPKKLGELNNDQIYRSLFLPLQDREFLLLSQTIFGEFERALMDADEKTRDIALSDYRFLLILVTYISGAIIERRCSDQKATMMVTIDYENLVKPSWDEMGDWFDLQLQQYKGARNLCRDAFYTFKYRFQRKQKLVGDLFPNSSIWLMGQMQNLKRDYLDIENICYSQKEVHRLISSRSFLPINAAHGGWSTVIDTVLNAIVVAYPSELGGIDFSEISLAWSKRLARVEMIYEDVRDSKDKPARLFVTGGTNPFRKIAILALQREGVDVGVFYHGNDFGARIQIHGHRGEVSHCKKFYCPTENICASYRSIYQNIPIEKLYETSYVPVYHSGEDSFLQYQRKAEGAPGSVVMIIGRPLNFRRLVDAHSSHFLQKVDFELRLMAFVKQLGYDVVYKCHPEWENTARVIYGPKGIRIISGNFEETWSSADIFVFSTVTTTTFGFALSTNIPIVLFDAVGNAWQDSVNKVLANRCEIVPYRNDDAGRAILELDQIENAINCATVKRNSKEIYQHMFVPE